MYNLIEKIIEQVPVNVDMYYAGEKESRVNARAVTPL